MRRLLVFCLLGAVLGVRSYAHAQALPPSVAGPQNAAAAPLPASSAVQPVPSAVVPPAPMTQPPPYAPRLDPRAAAYSELLHVDRALVQLRRERPRLFWPVALVVVGGGMAVGGSSLALLLWATAREPRYGWDNKGNRYEYTYVDREHQSLARAPAGAAAVGLAILGGGLALLIPRIKARREHSRRVAPLHQRRLQLLQSIGYSLNIDHQRTSLSARIGF